MLKKIIIFSFLCFLFSFSYASVFDSDKGKIFKKEQKCKKRYGADIEKESTKPSDYFKAEQIEEEQQQKDLKEERELATKQEQKTEIHSFNFLYYLIHHYKFSDFITQ